MVCGLNLWDEQIEQGKLIEVLIVSMKVNYVSHEHQIGESSWRLIILLNPLNIKHQAQRIIISQLPAVRFPGWHYCTNHKCGRMRKVPLGTGK